MLYDRSNIQSILGLRFRDATTERDVTRGLKVSLWREDRVGGVATAVRTASGAYVVQGVPGLRGYERSATSVADGSISCLVSVEDERSRFVPELLRVQLPYTPNPASGGLYPILETPDDLEGEASEPACYLFSSVQRPVISGQVVLYADLVEDVAGTLRPASHAVLEVHYDPSFGLNGSSVWYGVADADGRVAAQFALPLLRLEELDTPPSPGGPGGVGDGGPGDGGPGGGNGGPGRPGNGAAGSIGGQPLSSRTWPITVRARYEPSAREEPGNAGRPLLPSIFQQRRGTLYSDASTSATELSETFTYGSSLTLGTSGLPDGRTALKIDPHPGGP